MAGTEQTAQEHQQPNGGALPDRRQRRHRQRQAVRASTRFLRPLPGVTTTGQTRASVLGHLLYKVVFLNWDMAWHAKTRKAIEDRTRVAMGDKACRVQWERPGETYRWGGERVQQQVMTEPE
ncbi:hypothetical protein MC885_019635 [Smutsia gigantea]|nr:hypothetical protein MC885_019635 [Smutsia gigantea]